MWENIFAMWENIFASIIILAAAYMAVGLRIVKQREFIVVERLGKYHRIAHAGIRVLCLPGLIDSVKYRGDLKLRRLDLYVDEKNNQIDFKDGSCPVKIQVWWKIGDPTAKKDEDVDNDIYKFVYAAEKPENKLEEMVDAFARPRLQDMTIDEANIKKDHVAKDVNDDPGIKQSLSDIGSYLDPKKGCLITDIALTEDIVKLRKQEMEGSKDAVKAAKKGAGYAQAIAAIIEEAKKAGKEISFQDAREIYERQRGLETVGETGANITFVSPGIQGLMTTLGIGETGQKQRPKNGGKP